LQPPLATAASAKPLIVDNGCSLQYVVTTSKPCVYGDPASPVTVAVFGDSHAAAWFPALNVISRQQHWRLVDFTKAGCPPPEVNIVFYKTGAPYPQCTAWRHNAEAQIAAMQPTLVVVSEARFLNGEARPEQGIPTGHGGTWLNGLAYTFARLRQAADHVVFISDVPILSRPAPTCIEQHASDVRLCARSRSRAVVRPDLKRQELALARALNIDTVDPIPWFCTKTSCPAIVNHMILYRDTSHIVPVWSRFLAPLLAKALLPVMRGTPTSAVGG
jgi:hypothetical protein